MKKKLIAIILAILLLIPMAQPVIAFNDEEFYAANWLYKMGLFKGTGVDEYGNPIFDLDLVPTRDQAVTMLVRLLNREAEALNGNWNLPFTDLVEWVKPYVGFAYSYRLTAGTSDTTYSGNLPVTAAQYLTFVLRALGYSSDTDFEYNKAWLLSDEIGLTHGEYNEFTTEFTRADVAVISYNALNCYMKSGEMTLYEYLNNSPDTPRKDASEMEIVCDLSIHDSIEMGDKIQLSVITTPLDANIDGLIWEVDELSTDILKVSQDGIVEAIGPGVGIIWARLPNTTMACRTIAVKKESPVKITNITSIMDTVGGVTWTFDVENNSDRAMKYVTVRWHCYNAVEDIIFDTISWSDTFTCRVTGPIDPYDRLESMSNVRPFYNYDFANIISFVEIIIDYMDGEVEIVTPQEYYNYTDIENA